MWTKTFKGSTAAEDDVHENDVEMTVEGGASSVGAPTDEDVFEKQMSLSYETTTEELRASTTPRYVKTQALDQLQEWMKENPIPYISNDKFSQEGTCGIDRVFFSAGKQHDALKKRTMEKTLENTLKTSINMTLPTCDDKGVFTDDDDTYRKHK